VPSDKICERLKEKDASVCQLMFEKKVDINNVDLKYLVICLLPTYSCSSFILMGVLCMMDSKLRVKELKTILSDWGEQCEGCIDKVISTPLTHSNHYHPLMLLLVLYM
jgi:hypothetical protein